MNRGRGAWLCHPVSSPRPTPPPTTPTNHSVGCHDHDAAVLVESDEPAAIRGDLPDLVEHLVPDPSHGPGLEVVPVEALSVPLLAREYDESLSVRKPCGIGATEPDYRQRHDGPRTRRQEREVIMTLALRDEHPLEVGR